MFAIFIFRKILWNVTNVNKMMETLLHLNMKGLLVLMSIHSAVNVPQTIVKVLKMAVNLLQRVKLIFVNNSKEEEENNFIVILIYVIYDVLSLLLTMSLINKTIVI